MLFTPYITPQNGPFFQVDDRQHILSLAMIRLSGRFCELADLAVEQPASSTSSRLCFLFVHLLPPDYGDASRHFA